MKKMMMVLSFALVSGAANAFVNTNLYDNFSGLQADALNGTVPDIAQGSVVWDSKEEDPIHIRDLRADGSFTSGAAASRAGSLPFWVESGKIYTLSVNLSLASMDPSSDHWAGIGLNSSSQPDNIITDSFANLLLRRNGGAQGLTIGGGATVNITGGTYTATQELVVVLDTSVFPWTAGFSISGTPHGTRSIDVTACTPGEKYFSIGQFSTADGAFDELLLTVQDGGLVHYHDDFSGAVDSALNGTAPDTRPASEVWVAGEHVPLVAGDIRADGSFAGGAGSLAFTVESNKAYALTVDLAISNMDSGGTQWAGIGFNSSSQTNSMITDAFANILVRRNGGAQALTINGGATINIASGTYDGSNELEMILNTSNSIWTVEFLIDGTSFGTNAVDLLDTSFGTKYISIGSLSTTAGTFDNFVLREVSAASGAATIVEVTVASTNMLKLVIDEGAGNLGSKRVLGREDLSLGAWEYVAHSDNGVNPFVVTNLGYSTADGTNVTIYVHATNSVSFFGIE